MQLQSERKEGPLEEHEELKIYCSASVRQRTTLGKSYTFYSHRHPIHSHVSIKEAKRLRRKDSEDTSDSEQCSGQLSKNNANRVWTRC